MTTLITGGASSGKTTKAKEITNGKKTIWIDANDLDKTFALSKVTEETEYIVVEHSKTNYEEVKHLMHSTFLNIDRQGKESIAIPTPNIIVVSDSIKKKHIRSPRIKVIEL